MLECCLRHSEAFSEVLAVIQKPVFGYSARPPQPPFFLFNKRGQPNSNCLLERGGGVQVSRGKPQQGAPGQGRRAGKWSSAFHRTFFACWGAAARPPAPGGSVNTCSGCCCSSGALLAAAAAVVAGSGAGREASGRKFVPRRLLSVVSTGTWSLSSAPPSRSPEGGEVGARSFCARMGERERGGRDERHAREGRERGRE